MIIRVTPDKERVKSMLKLIKNREDFIPSIDIEKFSTIVGENYYEIIKELATALILLDGLKVTGEGAHKELIDYLLNYGFSEDEILLMNDLRIKRNKSFYEGKMIDKDYLLSKKDKFLKLIKKLKRLINAKL